MAWFNLFQKKDRKNHTDVPTSTELVLPTNDTLQKPESEQYATQAEGIQLIYNYLQKDFEKKGYEDAHISADEGYKNDNIQLIKYDLEIRIHQIKTYHDSLKKDIDFHIQSRSRAGLIDLVDELKIKQQDLLDHIQKVKEIEENLKQDTGLCARAILAYKRGFMKGMASITQSYLLSKKF